MIWCTNDPNVDIHTFRKRWSFIWGYFSIPIEFREKIHCQKRNPICYWQKRFTRTVENNCQKLETLRGLNKKFPVFLQFVWDMINQNNKFDFKSMCFLCGTVESITSAKDLDFPVRVFDFHTDYEILLKKYNINGENLF